MTVAVKNSCGISLDDSENAVVLSDFTCPPFFADTEASKTTL